MTDPRYFFARLDAQGRLLIPAEARRALGAAPGDQMAMTLEEGELRVVTYRENIRRIQEAAAKYSTGRSMVDQLIAERRAEAAKDDEETREYRRRHGIPEPTPDELERQAAEAMGFIRKWLAQRR
jgi:AbrB family looped-hinge helix DNA binding protein